MRKTNQNQVPEHFNALYLPMVNLKKILSGKSVESVASKQLIEGFVLLHYTTFLMNNLYHQTKRNSSRWSEIKTLAEEALAKDEYNLLATSRSKIFSFIDNLGKEINTTPESYLYIAMYSAHLDAEIYRHFNAQKGIYDFLDGYLINSDTKEILKQKSLIAHARLNCSNTSLSRLEI